MKAYRKAIAGFLAATVTAIGTAMADGDLTRPEVVIAIGAGLVTGAAVYAAPRNEYR